MNPKKVICTVTNDLTYDQRMQRICSALADEGYDVTLIGRLRKTSLPLTEKNYKELRLKCVFNKGKLFYLEYNIRLFVFLINHRFDIVNSNDLDTLVACKLASELKRKPLVFDAHELFTEVPEVINRPIVRKVWLFVEAWGLRKLKHGYTVCNSLADYFNQKYQTRFTAIRNVPYSAKNQINLALANKLPEGAFMLYQGALNKGRGLEMIIDIMPELDCKLVICGEGDLSNELRKRASNLNLNGKVYFLGMVTPNHLVSITKRAWLGLNVSENLGLSYYYSLNNKVFDYIQAGLPAITNNFPEYIALNNEYEVLVLCEPEKQALKNCIQYLIKHPEVCNKLRENCVIAREKLHWDIEKTKLLALYAEIR